jgi:dephospho-CoA kinase
MKIVGLTGGIGSGKSVIAQIFRTLGVPVYDTDQRAREIYFVPEVRKQVEELLGKEAYLSGTALNKKFISSKIFGDESFRTKINSIIHPAVKKDFENYAAEHRDERYIVKESALLLEAGLRKSMDLLIVITSPEALRIERLQKRGFAGKEEIVRIMQKQLSDSQKIKEADWVIKNDEENLLIPQVLEIHRAI